MTHIWELYEDLKEIVYVSDADTYEIVYINRYGREFFGLQSQDELKGRHCYEVLQKCSSPCAICSNKHLKVGQFHEWRYYNGLLGKTFLLKDTLIEENGRRYRLEISIDIGETDIQKKTIKEFSSNEAMVNDAIRLSLAESTPEKGIRVLLKHLGQSLKSDRVYIFEGLPGMPVKNTYEWCAGGVEPQIDYLQEVPFEVVSLWYEAFRDGENIVIKGLDSIRLSHPKVYETLLPQQVDTLVVSPIVNNGQVVGFYGVDNPPKEFLNHISVMFMVMGYFISSLLKRRDLLARLEYMSYVDPLTGALNRNSMNEFIAHVDHSASIGIVYFDVMGLKLINDTQGHLAGDELLMRTYRCLCEIFPRKSVFRIGGDEFLVLDSHVGEDEQNARVQRLKEILPEHDLNLAVGAIWEKQCNGRIVELMKQADERMYEEKAAYYSTRQNNRRNR